MNDVTQWDNLHTHYKTQSWISKHNIFAEEVLPYFQKSGSLLCLGDDDNGKTYKDAEKGVHNLVRYIGRKDAKHD